ncbi:hypothetical protein AKO1_012381 [Acrasis kona]|uniref:HVA22-like protein n=1 Tax=Acrasis kona TaxID=1008807 RepID=A0AAW2YLX7_9EUKA
MSEGGIFETLEVFVYQVLTNTICNALCFLYPAYASYKAIKSNGTADDKQWLTYWVTFGLLHVMEFWFGPVLEYIPLYWLLKSGFVLWLQHPSTKGATTLYYKYVQPFLKNNEARIDQELSQSGRYAATGVAMAANRLSQALGKEQKQKLAETLVTAAINSQVEDSKTK